MSDTFKVRLVNDQDLPKGLLKLYDVYDVEDEEGDRYHIPIGSIHAFFKTRFVRVNGEEESKEPEQVNVPEKVLWQLVRATTPTVALVAVRLQDGTYLVEGYGSYAEMKELLAKASDMLDNKL